MASPGFLNVLDPIPLNQLHDGARPPSKKRKICSSSNVWGSRTLIIRAHAASLSNDPFVLEPIAIVRRSRLPFEWLDTPSTLSQIHPGRLFVANIPILETELDAEPAVLVVRLVSDRGLYVVERVKVNLYALSKLTRNVEEGDVLVAMKASSHPVGVSPAADRPASSMMIGGEPPHGGSDWWRMAQIEDPVPDIPALVGSKRARVDVAFGADADLDSRTKEISPMDLMDGPPTSLDRIWSYEPPISIVLPDSQGIVGTPMFGDTGELDSAPVMQSPQELLDGLREQYLQALYISKASVAYFAKGPLPRCRAAFQSSGPRSSELLNYYREAILTSKKMDLKYRETLPSKLSDILISISDDEITARKKKPKAKRTKKALEKNGLYPEEEEFIRRWWKDRTPIENGPSIETSREAELKKQVSDLRLRETQLQILLILETMALEIAAADESKKSPENECPPTSNGTPQGPKRKAKKPRDLNVMLELHLDRLCIWHTVSFDDAAIADASKSFGSNHPPGKVVESDAMRDFCTEVIIPFYASRLPERCKSITRKFGVSAGVISPFAKSSSTKKIPRQKSDANVERHQPQKLPRRRTLQRVLTDEQTSSQGRSQPSLSRSNTAPSQTEAKRESTNPLLPILTTTVRGGIQKAKRAENREVDLNAVARQHETKLKRVQMLADQKKELDAAILTLRKPNRELVAKDIATDADRRLTSGGSSRKPKNPVRNPLGQGVQVMATPRGSRKKDTNIGLPLPKTLVRSSSSRFPRVASTSSIFSSPSNGEGAPQVIPGSTIRPIASLSGGMRSADVGTIQETPSRRPTQPFGSFIDDSVPNVAESPSFPGGTAAGKNLFRVPRRPAPRPTDSMAPSTPVATRHVDVTDEDAGCDMGISLVPSSCSRPLPPPPVFALQTGKSNPSGPIQSSSMITQTPPKHSPIPVIHPSGNLIVPGPKIGPSVVPVTPEKSIYAQLGWDDDDDELAF